jgi:hypothetical protein
VRVALRRVPASRWPSIPRWVIALLVVYAAVIVAGAWLARRHGVDFVLCQFKRVTGRPCPGCGSTRGVLALLEGRPLEAWLWNPLVMSALGALVLLATLRAATARRFELELDRPTRALAWTCGSALLVANWIWLWDRA